jgi:hypothetical protein
MNKILNIHTNTNQAQSKTKKTLLGWLARILDWFLVFNVNVKPKNKEEKIGLFVLIIVIGFAVAVGYHYFIGVYMDKPWPANTFLFSPDWRFSDFDYVVRQSAALDPFGKDIGGFEGAPFGQFVGYLFSIVPIAWLQLGIFFVFFYIAFLLMTKYYLYGSKSKLTPYRLLTMFIIVFLTYPVLFAVDRGNFDLLVCVLLLLFAFTYERQKYRASTIFLALAIAIKPYAAIFIIVYFLDKKFKDGLLVIFNTVFLTVLSLSLFKDGLIVETQKYFHILFGRAEYLLGNQQGFTSDLFGLLTVGIKFIGDTLGIDKNGFTMYLPSNPGLKVAYGLAVIGIAIYFVIYLWKKHPPLWKVLSVLTILVILLPFSSYDYRLVYLFVPLLMYLAINNNTRNDLLTIILWGLLLVPKNYYTLSPPKNIGTIMSTDLFIGQNIGVVINPLLLIGLLISIIPKAFSLRGFFSVFRSADMEIKTKELVIKDESM